MFLRFGGHKDHIRGAWCIVYISQFILFRCPKIDHIVIAFGGQQFSIHGRRSDDSDLARMTYDLLYFQIWMLLRCIIVEQCFKVVYEIMLVVWDLYIRHDYIVGGVCPVVINGAIYSVSFA